MRELNEEANKREGLQSQIHDLEAECQNWQNKANIAKRKWKLLSNSATLYFLFTF